MQSTHFTAASETLIRNFLLQLQLFELVNLCYLPDASPDQKLAAERAIQQKLPTTPLGNKITLARRGTTNILSELIKEDHPQLFEFSQHSRKKKILAEQRKNPGNRY